MEAKVVQLPRVAVVAVLTARRRVEAVKAVVLRVVAAMAVG